MKYLIAIALLSTAIVSGASYAQQAQPAERAAPAATAPAASAEKMMLKNNWRASKLMGLDVYNEANEKLGDINELILDKNGRVNAVVIEVGGFLGMGEHDIAVTMDKLKFIEERTAPAPLGPQPRRAKRRPGLQRRRRTPPAQRQPRRRAAPMRMTRLPIMP